MSHHQSIIERALAWWQARKDIRGELVEIGSLSPSELSALEAECGVSAVRLTDIIKAGHHGADEMRDMMDALNIDPLSVDLLDRRLFQDMQAVCATCDSKAECRGDLKSGEAAIRYHQYCGNAETLDALRGMPGMLATS